MITLNSAPVASGVSDEKFQEFFKKITGGMASVLGSKEREGDGFKNMGPTVDPSTKFHAGIGKEIPTDTAIFEEGIQKPSNTKKSFIKQGRISADGIHSVHKMSNTTPVYASTGALYQKDGKIVQIEKGTEVLFERKDNKLHIMATQDPVTKRYQAYAQIIGTIDTQGVITQGEGYIRVPSLDIRINKIVPTTPSPVSSHTSPEKNETVGGYFDGHLGPDSQEVRGGDLKNTVTRYMRDTMLPYALEQSRQRLAQARATMIQEVIQNRISKEESSTFGAYMKHLEQFKRYDTLMKLSKTDMEAFLVDPTIQMYIQQLYQKPIWKTFISNSMRSSARK